MSHIPVVWWIAQASVAAVAPLMVLERGAVDALGDARGWLRDRLGRYPTGYHGGISARLEEYDAGAVDLVARPDLPAPPSPSSSATARAARLVAADLYRLGATFKRHVGTAEEGRLVLRMHDVAGKLGLHADTLAARCRGR